MAEAQLDLFGARVEFRFCATTNRDRGAVRGEASRTGCPDSAAATGDEYGHAFEPARRDGTLLHICNHFLLLHAVLRFRPTRITRTKSAAIGPGIGLLSEVPGAQ